jgi:hypothetical protein
LPFRSAIGMPAPLNRFAAADTIVMELNLLPPPFGKHPIGFFMFEAELIGVVVDGSLSLPADVPSRAFVAYSWLRNVEGADRPNPARLAYERET